ncbi:MAG: hypothetical protein A4E45_01789 [Methanosaeta sp. PtaB.Bin039]|nr:MAG: hypothetical protein A4E45_01789 [Methanosaeta sp. PtaB.Bin039]HOT08018.1 hypothetical protein [Methanotrichaceae archaeon]HQF17444.1 hypothetical protein [Methanotrichaceae archaeon]HQI92062.1 hypothetical protein [Methanotrichaceae archaeon]HQJ29445.1 hypothetical protein [Methanotrichaceae archaeon]
MGKLVLKKKEAAPAAAAPAAAGAAPAAAAGMPAFAAGGSAKGIVLELRGATVHIAEVVIKQKK